MRHDLESLRDQMNRLERQLRVFQIAAVVLAVSAIAFALAPRTGAQEPGSMRVRQLIVEDANGRPRVVIRAAGRTRQLPANRHAHQRSQRRRTVWRRVHAERCHGARTRRPSGRRRRP